jgi:hypothetical protein
MWRVEKNDTATHICHTRLSARVSLTLRPMRRKLVSTLVVQPNNNLGPFRNNSLPTPSIRAKLAHR